MGKRNAQEQHIAVFGETGSGKTVLISSFLGSAQETDATKTAPFRVVADDSGQGNRLRSNYLGMKNQSARPQPTRFSSTPFAFQIQLKDQPRGARELKLVWHDYPGEWFEQTISGAEAELRLDTFRALLGSDVAILLVDAQELLQYEGEEERYLKKMLGNVSNGIAALKSQLLVKGKPLVRFPRIWILALSKSDLVPDWDVQTFRDLMIEKACDEIEDLRIVLSEIVQSNEALSVGEDFLLLSSAKFEVNKIDVSQRVGLNLILPIAFMLPVQRFVRWMQARSVSRNVAESLLGSVNAVLSLLVGVTSKFPKLGNVAKALGPALMQVTDYAGDELKKANAQALAKGDMMQATLTYFQIELEKGDERGVLIRSSR